MSVAPCSIVHVVWQWQSRIVFRKYNELYFGGLDLQYRKPEMWFPIEKDDFRASQGKQIQTEYKERFETKVVKQKQLCVAVAAVAVVVSEIPC